ncbi:MAG: glutathione S-transferase family protein [Gammaproteobacteria bacterium]|nr:glutathione S-transferase family protein [Gammaproteobacteria bacterium]MCB1849709.1 glutathione S-transferase family protein [Gammaproteobacteria bacterium]MCP5415901.1 glutathione S-transferase family protein [Chromatiaceae bacterium]
MINLRLVIGNCNYSSWSLRPWFYLRHHAIAFETIKISLFTETMASELAPYFSDGKVPLLLHDELQVWDSLAILEYLAELFPEKRGWPAERGARAVARSVCAEMHSSFPDLRSELPMNCRRRFPGFRPTDAAARDIQRVFSVWHYCRQRYGRNGPWLFGSFSVADCMYAPVVMRLVSYAIDMDDLCRAYVDTLYHSAAAREWITMGQAEREVIQQDEANWPSEPI